MKNEGCESFMACAFLRNSNSDECGSLKKNFQTQCALTNDQHPKQISAVSDRLGSHQWDPAHEKRRKKEATKTRKSTEQ